MINPYYQQQLAYLRELAQAFSQENPALAPLLSSQGTDPDVERLLEGTAFLSGLIHQRLDDNFPDIVQGLIRLIFPHYLRPLPSASIIRFTPEDRLMEPLQIPRGTELAAKAVEGCQCTFTTASDVWLYPLHIQGLNVASSGKNQCTVHITCAFRQGISLQDCPMTRLRFHLAGSYATAADRYAGLCRSIRQIRLVSQEPTGEHTLASDCFQASGFDRQDALLPYPARTFPAFRLVQEYFLLPEKFLFFDITGLGDWSQHNSTSEFTIALDLDCSLTDIPSFKLGDLALYCTPVINVFDWHADPIQLDHTRSEYHIRPDGEPAHFRVYSVESVTGLCSSRRAPRDYQPFERFNPQTTPQPVYSLNRRTSKLHQHSDLYLSVGYVAQQTIQAETLSIRLRCTNGALPQQLHYGDITLPTDSSPLNATFTNITAPTGYVEPPLAGNLLWRLLSHLYLNQVSLNSADTLAALLKLYIFSGTSNREQALANTKRADSIQAVRMQRVRRLSQGIPVQVMDIHIKTDPLCFPCPGDRYLFGTLLHQFLAAYAAINCYTQLTLENSDSQELWQWPYASGKRFLL